MRELGLFKEITNVNGRASALGATGVVTVGVRLMTAISTVRGARFNRFRVGSEWGSQPLSSECDALVATAAKAYEFHYIDFKSFCHKEHCASEMNFSCRPIGKRVIWEVFDGPHHDIAVERTSLGKCRSAQARYPYAIVVARQLTCQQSDRLPCRSRFFGGGASIGNHAPREEPYS